MANQIWNIDASHSKIQFSVKHMVISTVTGQFDKFNLSVKSDKDDFSDAEIDFTIDSASVNTGIADRDNHLKSDDFFNAEKYPEIKFKSNSLTKISDEEYKLSGDLTIREVTKPIDLKVEFGGVVKDPWGLTRAGFSIVGAIDRFDYNLKWNSLIETGGAVVAKNVKILCDVEIVKQ